MNARLASGRELLVLMTAMVCSTAEPDPVSIQVNGTMVETIVAFALAGPHQIKVHARDVVAGDLEGTAQLHIYNSEIVDPFLPHVANVLSTRNQHERGDAVPR